MISLPKHNWIKQEPENARQQVYSYCTSSCRQAKRFELESLSKELQASAK
ncbi:hypothetical protein ACLK1S_13580 [Escherichia coli]